MPQTGFDKAGVLQLFYNSKVLAQNGKTVRMRIEYFLEIVLVNYRCLWYRMINRERIKCLLPDGTKNPVCTNEAGDSYGTD